MQFTFFACQQKYVAKLVCCFKYKLVSTHCFYWNRREGHSKQRTLHSPIGYLRAGKKKRKERNLPPCVLMQVPYHDYKNKTGAVTAFDKTLQHDNANQLGDRNDDMQFLTRSHTCQVW